MALTEAQKAQYERDGYLVFEGLFGPEDVSRMLRRVEDLVYERRPVPEGVRLQLEPAVERGEAAATDRMLALRKIECLAIYDDVFAGWARDPRLQEVAQALLGPDVKLFRDALMMKPPHHGSAKPYHQDSAYWRIDPPALSSCWMALDDATRENGCMRVIPGSHRWGPVEHKHLEDYQVEDSRLDLSQEVAVPLKAGGCLFFHSLLLHATAPNNSPRPRRGMIASCMSARARYTGPEGTKPNYPLLAGREYPGCV